MPNRFVLTAFVTGMMTVAAAFADTPAPDAEAIKATLTGRFPKIGIIDVHPSPMPALYEVYTGRQIYYTDDAGNFLIDGTLIDARTQADLTSTRVDERNHIDFSALPFDRSIAIVKGNGSRKLAVFTDPDCPYCRKFEEELKSVTDVTIYVFLFPLKIHPMAAQRSREIWCAQDRAKAWTDYLLDKKLPKTRECRNDPVAETIALGKKLNLTGTPTVFFASGERRTGGLELQDLQTKLTEPAAASGSCRAPSSELSDSAAGRDPKACS